MTTRASSCLSSTPAVQAPLLAVFFCLAALTGACGSDAEPEPDAMPPDPVGTFTTSWTVSDGAGVVGCGDLGANTVRITAVEINSAFGQIVTFPCNAGSGTSRLLAAGTYRLDFDLRTGDARSLLPSQLRVEDVVIEIGGDAAVEAQAFSVVPSGSLSFRAAASGVTMGNCALEADGGAGIVGFRFNLRDGAMACVNSTFAIAAGGQAGGTYVSDCTDAQTFGCIEPDQIVTVDPTRSGARTLEILGIDDAGLPCRRHLAQFEQPGNNLSVDLAELGMQINAAELGCVAARGP